MSGPLTPVSLPTRTREQRVTQAPVEFTLGGESVRLRVLTIAETRSLKEYASQRLGSIAGSGTSGEELVGLIMRLLRDSTDEMLDVVLRYDLDGTIPDHVVDDSAGLVRSSWVDEHATELEVEDAFLAVVTVLFPFVRRARSLIEGQDWTTLLRSLRELVSKGQTPKPSPSSTS